MTKAPYPELESSTLEFKSTFPKSDQIIKIMIAFCNHHGAKLSFRPDPVFSDLHKKQEKPCR